MTAPFTPEQEARVVELAILAAVAAHNARTDIAVRNLRYQQRMCPSWVAEEAAALGLPVPESEGGQGNAG